MSKVEQGPPDEVGMHQTGRMIEGAVLNHEGAPRRLKTLQCDRGIARGSPAQPDGQSKGLGSGYNLG